MRAAAKAGELGSGKPGRRRLTTHRGISAPSKFESARFEAKLHELKHLPSGEMRVVILIPETDSDEGTKLRDAYSCALEVAVRKGSFT